jgi:hypothetical protein
LEDDLQDYATPSVKIMYTYESAAVNNNRREKKHTGAEDNR